MPDQKDVQGLGGTMRLGSYPCQLQKDSLVSKIYNSDLIHERHRHRYEFNNSYRDKFTSLGASLPGLSPDGRLVEIFELPSHPWFIGVQFHPEFQSRPNRAHRCFAILYGRHSNTRKKIKSN